MRQTHHVLGLTDRELSDFVTTPARIVAVVVVAVLLRWFVGRTIRRFVASTRDGRVSRRLMALGEHAQVLVDMSPTAVARRQQRATTVGVVLRSLSSTVILAVAVTIILDELGIDIAPIIASAGIIGVAVGFGAQNLVKDFLSGVFLVVEDTYGVGDTVDLGPATGTVEWIGLRSTRIRSVDGTLWSVRNGEINAVGNYSQVWQRAIFDVTVLHGQDIDLARDTMLAAATVICDRSPDVPIEPPAVWGVNEIRPEGVVLRLVVRRHTGNDGFDRALREELVAHLDDAGVRIFTLPAAVEIRRTDGGLDAGLDLGRVDARTPEGPVPAGGPAERTPAKKPSPPATRRAAPAKRGVLGRKRG